MEKLNLPTYDHNIKQQGDKTLIFDVIRKKYVVLTPEEWVRQHFIHYLISDLNYAKGLIKIEGGLLYNSLQKRSDILTYGRDAKPFMLVECKAPEVALSQATFRQAAMYNKTINARYVVLTNGFEHSCFTFNQTSNKVEFLDTIPSFEA